MIVSNNKNFSYLSLGWTSSDLYQTYLKLVVTPQLVCTRGIMKCPKKHVKDIFSHDGICICFSNAPKSNNFIFDSFFVLKLIRCFFLKCPNFFVRFFQMPHFFFLILKTGKWGISSDRFTECSFAVK